MSEPFGRYLINSVLPDKYKIRGEMTKSDMKKRLTDLAQNDPATFVPTVTNLKRVGDEIATSEGLSVGLDDITPQYGVRDKLLAPLRRKFKNASTDQQRSAIAAEAMNRMDDTVRRHPGSLTQQVSSGARGNWTQYSKMVGGLGGVRDAKGGTVPWMIERSYAEGLSPAEWYATTNQATTDVIKSSTSVSDPGELAKKLINVMNDSVVTEVDCGTNNGLMMDSVSPDVVDRYLARDTGLFKRNTLVTPTNQGSIARASKRIMVRSPMTCEAGDGVCQRCQGLDESGQTHKLGINVGVRSAQAMSEPLTQFALNAKHGGRTVESDKNQVQGISGFRQIIETPKQFINKATLSEVDGKVDKVESAPQGGHHVTVGGTSHYVSPDMGVKVKKGQEVARGDRLSQGVIKPDEVVRLKGLGPGREYMVKTLRNLYESQGKHLDSRHFELLAKSNMNHVRVLDDPSNRFIKGDVVSYNALRGALAKDTKTVALKDSVGEVLGKGHGQHTAGTRVTNRVIQDFKRDGIKNVTVAPRAPSVEFVMKSATSVPRMHPDWLARMAHRGLKSSVLQAAHEGHISNLHGTHPVPAYVHGVGFGQGESGRY